MHRAVRQRQKANRYREEEDPNATAAVASPIERDQQHPQEDLGVPLNTPSLLSDDESPSSETVRVSLSARGQQRHRQHEIAETAWKATHSGNAKRIGKHHQPGGQRTFTVPGIGNASRGSQLVSAAKGSTPQKARPSAEPHRTTIPLAMPTQTVSPTVPPPVSARARSKGPSSTQQKQANATQTTPALTLAAPTPTANGSHPHGTRGAKSKNLPPSSLASLPAPAQIPVLVQLSTDDELQPATQRGQQTSSKLNPLLQKSTATKITRIRAPLSSVPSPSGDSERSGSPPPVASPITPAMAAATMRGYPSATAMAVAASSSSVDSSVPPVMSAMSTRSGSREKSHQHPHPPAPVPALDSDPAAQAWKPIPSATSSAHTPKANFRAQHPYLSTSASTNEPSAASSLPSSQSSQPMDVSPSPDACVVESIDPSPPNSGSKPRFSARKHLPSPPVPIPPAAAATTSIFASNPNPFATATTIPASTTSSKFPLPKTPAATAAAAAKNANKKPLPLSLPVTPASSAASTKRLNESKGADLANPIMLVDDDDTSQRPSSFSQGSQGPGGSQNMVGAKGSPFGSSTGGGGTSNITPLTTTKKNAQQRKSAFQLVYPKSGRDQIVITDSDLALLKPGEFLNDSIVDFYLKYLMLEMQKTNPKRWAKLYCFNSFFYKKWILAAEDMGDGPYKVKHSSTKAYDAVSRWTKGVNIFEKDFIIVPINDTLHWSLAIICYPQKFFLPTLAERQNSNGSTGWNSTAAGGTGGKVTPAKRSAPLPAPSATAVDHPPSQHPHSSAGMLSNLVHSIGNGVAKFGGSVMNVFTGGGKTNKTTIQPFPNDSPMSMSDDPFGFMEMQHSQSPPPPHQHNQHHQGPPLKKQKLSKGEHKAQHKATADEEDLRSTPSPPADDSTFPEQKQWIHSPSASSHVAAANTASSTTSSSRSTPPVASTATAATAAGHSEQDDQDPTHIPAILYLDSLLQPPPRLFEHLSDWLKQEWKAKYPELSTADANKMKLELGGGPLPLNQRRRTYRWSQPPYFGGLPGSRPNDKKNKSFHAHEYDGFSSVQRNQEVHYSTDPPLYWLGVPEQKNGSDCGLYILEYTEQFVTNFQGPKHLQDHIKKLQDLQKQQANGGGKPVQLYHPPPPHGKKGQKHQQQHDPNVFENVFLNHWKSFPQQNMNMKRKNILLLLRRLASEVQEESQAIEKVQLAEAQQKSRQEYERKQQEQMKAQKEDYKQQLLQNMTPSPANKVQISRAQNLSVILPNSPPPPSSIFASPPTSKVFADDPPSVGRIIDDDDPMDFVIEDSQPQSQSQSMEDEANMQDDEEPESQGATLSLSPQL